MSYPIPSFDPVEDAVLPEDGNNGEAVREPQDAPEPDLDHARALYDAIIALNHASRDDLTIILNEINPTQLLAIAAIIEEARMEAHDKLYAK